MILNHFRFVVVVDEVLTQVRKIEESLLKLKRSRNTDESSAAVTVSDEDKIRKQLQLDVQGWSDVVWGCIWMPHA